MIDIIRSDRSPADSAEVAGLTYVSGIDMCGIFTSGIDAIVAVVTGLAYHGAVIKARHCPGINIMTGTTIQRGGYMSGGLARCRNPVMAGATKLTSQHRVIHHRGHCGTFKPYCRVTHIAGLVGRYMGGTHANGERIVMTQCAFAGQLFERATYVAVFAIQ